MSNASPPLSHVSMRPSLGLDATRGEAIFRPTKVFLRCYRGTSGAPQSIHSGLLTLDLAHPLLHAKSGHTAGCSLHCLWQVSLSLYDAYSLVQITSSLRVPLTSGTPRRTQIMPQ